MFIFSILLFLILFLNIKQNRKIVKVSFLVLSILLFLLLIIFNKYYFINVVDEILKCIINFIYFPPIYVYLLMVLISFIIIIFTVFSKNISKSERIVNYAFFSLILLDFTLFLYNIRVDNINIYSNVSIYSSDLLLSILQISNILFIIWLFIILMFKLYKYLKNKYDKELVK